MKLQLDSQALEKLFPEGTEARVELQQAVIQNIINRRFIKESNEQIKKSVDEAAKDFALPDMKSEIDTQLRALLQKKGYYDVEASDKLKEQVRLAVDQEAASKIRGIVYDSTKVAEERLNSVASANVKMLEQRLNKVMNEKFTQTFAKVLNDRFDDVVKEAIKLRMGL